MRIRARLATLREAGTLHLSKSVGENEGITEIGGQGVERLRAQQRE